MLDQKIRDARILVTQTGVVQDQMVYLHEQGDAVQALLTLATTDESPEGVKAAAKRFEEASDILFAYVSVFADKERIPESVVAERYMDATHLLNLMATYDAALGGLIWAVDNADAIV